MAKHGEVANGSLMVGKVVSFPYIPWWHPYYPDGIEKAAGMMSVVEEMAARIEELERRIDELEGIGRM